MRCLLDDFWAEAIFFNLIYRKITINYKIIEKLPVP
jgi:hypothetical protein